MLKENILKMLEHRQFQNNLLESDSCPTPINFVCTQTSKKRREVESGEAHYTVLMVCF